MKTVVSHRAHRVQRKAFILRCRPCRRMGGMDGMRSRLTKVFSINQAGNKNSSVNSADSNDRREWARDGRGFVVNVRSIMGAYLFLRKKIY